MPATARILVHYSEFYVLPDRAVNHEIWVEGPVHASFLDLFKSTAPTPRERSSLFAKTPSRTEEQSLIMMIDDQITLGQMAEMFEFDELHIDNSGRGGGSVWVAISEIFQVVGPIGRAVRASKGVVGALWSVQFADQRAKVKDWDDTGEISTELRQMVLAESKWRREQFDTVFGLSRDRGGVLLRELGYWRSGIVGRNEYWSRDESDEWNLPPVTN